MGKVFNKLKIYFVISFILAILLAIWAIGWMLRNNAVPSIDSIYILKTIFSTLGLTIIFVIGIAIIDLLLIQSIKWLIKDYKESDRRGRIILIIICISLLLRKILIWTR